MNRSAINKKARAR